MQILCLLHWGEESFERCNAERLSAQPKNLQNVVISVKYENDIICAQKDIDTGCEKYLHVINHQLVRNLVSILSVRHFFVQQALDEDN